jgi:spermidine synthase
MESIDWEAMPDQTTGATDHPSDDPWYTETLHEGLRTSIQVRRVLFDSQTEHQRLVVAESVAFGTLVMLDGVTQLTTADEYVYHEMLSHVPILAHGAVRDVLVIGGGDGGMIEELFKHTGIEHVTMAELDHGVIDLARTHLPELSNGAFDDPRLEIVIGDGKDYAATSDRRFDLVIVDSTDPIGPGEALFTPTFYADCRRLLRRGGVIVTQNGVPFFQADELEATMRAFAGLFADATCYLAAVPTYVGGFMAFGWGSDDPSLRRVSQGTLVERFAAAGFETRYYTPEVHLASFALPRFILEIVERAHRDVDASRPTGPR